MPSLSRTVAHRSNVASRWSVAALCAAVALAAICPAAAWAGQNDITFQRFGSCIVGSDAPAGMEPSDCVGVVTDDDAFDALSRDLGLVLAPRAMAPAETLGLAGYALSLDVAINQIDNGADHWKKAAREDEVDSTLSVLQFHFRKGLPFSFELGALLSHMTGSELWAIGAELKWALHEDFLWPVPDFAVRGFANTTVGHPQLNLTNVGFDLMLSVPLGVAGLFEITPIVGFTPMWVISSTRLMDATPEDSSPPVESGNPQLSEKPEFVFSNRTQFTGRGFVGVQARFNIVVVGLQTDFGADVSAVNLTFGADF